jgi:hypothetical protein
MNSETHIKSSTNNSTRARAQRSSTPRRVFLCGKLQITAGFARRMELTAGDRGFAMKQRTKKAPSRPPPPGPASQFVPRISLLSSSAAARGGFRLSGPDGLCGSGGVRVLGVLWGGAVCVCVCVCLRVCVCFVVLRDWAFWCFCPSHFFCRWGTRRSPPFRAPI